MHRFRNVFVTSAFSALLLAACSSDDDNKVSGPSKAEVVKNYAALVHENYEVALGEMKTLKTAVDAFVAAPSQATLDAAKAAWTKARQPYLTTEAFRFYGGPIDNEDTGPEGRINGWPLDENYIDYVDGNAEAGIINAKANGAFVVAAITKDVIKEKNEQGGEKNLSAGWHAIEFLLWGQDKSTTGPGNRPYTDYVVGAGGTAANQDRRGAYLKAVTELMVDDFTDVEKQWDVGTAGSYGAAFVAGSADEKIGDMLKGIGSLAGSELPKERMNNAYETRDQEEEHSCFSDTTDQDLVLNGVGIENVYLGQYGTLKGASISDLVKARDAALDEKTRADIAKAVQALKDIPKPFDQAIVDDKNGGRSKVKAAINAWQPVTDDVIAVAAALGVKINLE